MKKYPVCALAVIISLILISCEPESEDPPVFDNGLMVTLGQNQINSGGIASQKDFTARSYVNCKYEFGNLYTFSAKTSGDEEWIVKFRYDQDTDDSLVYLDENSSNMIQLNSPEDSDIGDYYIDASSDNADQTVIRLIRLVPNEIIEAEFEGFIFKSGSPAVPDTLKEGYLITKTFTTPVK